MDLWIRTQDRMRLVKPRRLAIKQETKNWGGDWYIYESQNSLRYGTYATKERALEVLDDIQDILKPKLHHISDKDLEGNDIKVLGIEYVNSIIYEMPKE